MHDGFRETTDRITKIRRKQIMIRLKVMSINTMKPKKEGSSLKL